MKILYFITIPVMIVMACMIHPFKVGLFVIIFEAIYLCANQYKENKKRLPQEFVAIIFIILWVLSLIAIYFTDGFIHSDPWSMDSNPYQTDYVAWDNESRISSYHHSEYLWYLFYIRTATEVLLRGVTYIKMILALLKKE